MIIDRKFRIKAINPCNGRAYNETNSFLICAKDAAAVPCLIRYKEACIELKCNQEHIDSIQLLIERVMTYQTTVEQKIPDTVGACEVARCINGEGLEEK